MHVEFVSAPSSVLFSLCIINISNYSYSEEKKKNPVTGSLHMTFDLWTAMVQYFHSRVAVLCSAVTAQREALVQIFASCRSCTGMNVVG